MEEYRFRFLNRRGRVEADFCLTFETEKEAIKTARELQSHSPFSVMEVKKGRSLVLHLDRSDEKGKR